jgi:hypothetical protein
MFNRTLVATLGALAVLAASARAQAPGASPDREDISIRSVPVEASTISSIARSADQILGAEAHILNDAARFNAAPATVVGVQESISRHQGVTLSGGLDQSLASSLTESAVRLEPIGTTSSGKRIGMKSIILRLVGGTILFGFIATVGMLVFGRYSGAGSAA